MVVTTVDAIKTKTKTTHIKLALGEMLNAGRVVYMSKDLMAERGLQLAAAFVEKLKLVG